MGRRAASVTRVRAACSHWSSSPSPVEGHRSSGGGRVEGRAGLTMEVCFAFFLCLRCRFFSMYVSSVLGGGEGPVFWTDGDGAVMLVPASFLLHAMGDQRTRFRIGAAHFSIPDNLTSIRQAPDIDIGMAAHFVGPFPPLPLLLLIAMDYPRFYPNP